MNRFIVVLMTILFSLPLLPVEAQINDPHEYIFIMWDTNDSSFRMSSPSSIYGSLGVDDKADELESAVDFLPDGAGLIDYLAIIGVWGYRLDGTIETNGLLIILFSRPITIPLQTEGA